MALRCRYFATVAAVAVLNPICLKAQSAAPAGVSSTGLHTDQSEEWTSTADSSWNQFVQMFDVLTDHDSIVGAAIAFVRAGRVTANHEHGFADRRRAALVSERTIFNFGSITKTLTAIAIMQLRDQGRLTLDDRVTSYLPELKLVHDPYGSMDSITIRMLLSHSAGFQDATWPYKQGRPWEPFEPTTWSQLVAMMPYQELLFRPGSRYGYSNPGFIYLGRIIEQLSGDPWQLYVQKNILSPLGLTRSYFGATPFYLVDDRSHNYTLGRDSSGEQFVRDNGADFDPGITVPNGGWNASLSDIVAYISFLTNATQGDSVRRRRYDTVLSRASLSEMWEARFPVSPDNGAEREWMGLSFRIRHFGDATLIGHNGHQAGFIAFLYFNPANGSGVIAAFNTDDARDPASSRFYAFRTIREAALARLR